jgi:hypothetical protein
LVQNRNYTWNCSPQVGRYWIDSTGTFNPGENKALLQKPICLYLVDYINKIDQRRKIKIMEKTIREEKGSKKKKIAMQDLTICVGLFALISYNISKCVECRMPVRSIK